MVDSDNTNNPWYNDPAPIKVPQKAPEIQKQATPMQDSAVKKVRWQMNMGTFGKAGIGIIVILIAIAAIMLIGSLGNGGSGATTTLVTTINGATVLTGCTTITSPGTYYLNRNINVTLGQGMCISVQSSNVELIGDQNKLTGSGPFAGVPPYTYGIYVGSYNNVTINGVGLSSFSYGIYLNGTTGSTLMFNNVTNVAMAGIFLDGASNNLVVNNTVSNAASQSGAINLHMSQNNRIFRDVIINNANYGLISNATNNTYQNDIFSNNPVDLFCPFLNTSFRNSNLFGSASCNTNNYCNFAQCTTTNLPSNISSFILSPPLISSCGGIVVPGKYELARDINMNNYLNSSNPLASSQSCLKVNAPNVQINCNGHSISQSPYAINASGQFNTTVVNCMLLNNSVAGISADSNFNLKVSNTTVVGGKFGVQATNGTIATIANLTTSQTTYGIYVNSSGAFSIGNFKSTNNAYGMYIDGTIGITMSQGALLNNSKSDLWCTATTYNSTQNQYQSVQLTKTDCQWATGASIYQKPPITLFPVSSCYTVLQSGNYSLSANVVGGNKCINIQASNVNFDCKNFQITSGIKNGTAIFIAPGKSNVDISNCKIKNFQYGITSSNATGTILQKNNIESVSAGIWLLNVSNAQVLSNYIQNAQGVSTFVLNWLTNANIFGNTAFDTVGKNATDGFLILNTTQSSITFNNATSTSGYGFVFGNSINNSIYNNSARINGNADFFCSNSSSGLYVESGGVNIGDVEQNCKWMVAINPITTLQQPCLAITSATTIILSSDMVYKFGATCFNIHNNPPLQVVNDSARPATSANGTVINCAYHTVLASHGGTFVDIVNSSSVVVENCYLKNFTNAVIATGFQPIVRNNTFTSIANTSINIYNAQYAKVLNNRILNTTTGIYMSYVRYATISKNFIANAANTIVMLSGRGNLVNSTTSSFGANGILISNSSVNNYQNNKILNMTNFGFFCVGSVGNVSSGNLDLGNNVCSSNKGCMWMGGSSQCSPQ